MSVSVEKCFEDAEESGCLQILHKGLKQFPVCVDSYDLLDVTTVGKLKSFVFNFFFFFFSKYIVQFIRLNNQSGYTL